MQEGEEKAFAASMAETKAAYPGMNQDAQAWRVTQRYYWERLIGFDISVVRASLKICEKKHMQFFPSLGQLLVVCEDRQKSFVAVQEANKYPQLTEGHQELDPADGPKTAKGKTVEALINALGKPQGPEEVKKYIKGVSEILANI